MKIAIDISPLTTGHKVRGVGSYVAHLKKSLENNFPENSYQFFNDKNEILSDIDLIHYPYFDPFVLSQPLLKKKPTIVTVHDLTPMKFHDHFPVGIKGAFYWQINKQYLKYVDHIITDSLASKKDIITFAQIPEQKISVVHLAAGEQFKKVAITQEKREYLRKKYNLPDRFLLYVGDITWNKNVPRIVEAAIKAEIPLVLVGKAIAQKNYDRAHPWNRDLVKVQKMIEQQPSIYALGYVEDDDIIHLYTMASVFLFPSLYEGFGLPVLEAMACGTPVITSKSGSLEEISEDAAYFVDPTNVDDIKNGLLKVFHDKALQNELSMKGLKQSEKFSWKATAQNTLEVYKRVLKK